MNNKLFSTIVLLAFFVVAAPAEAYLSQNKSAERVGDQYRIFSVDFRWGFDDKDLLIPVIATRAIKNGDTMARLGFDITNAQGLRVKNGTTTAMVVADLPIENGYYRLKAGENKRFKLLALHQSASTTLPVRLQVSSLPFRLESNKGQSNTFLRPHELKGYVTEAI